MAVIYQGGELQPDPRADLQARIAAKADLWAFLKDAGPDIANYRQGPGQLAKEIAGTCMKLLHPWFNAAEIQSHVADVMTTLHVHEPQTYMPEIQQLVIDELLKKVLKAGK